MPHTSNPSKSSTKPATIDITSRIAELVNSRPHTMPIVSSASTATPAQTAATTAPKLQPSPLPDAIIERDELPKSYMVTPDAIDKLQDIVNKLKSTDLSAGTMIPSSAKSAADRVSAITAHSMYPTGPHENRPTTVCILLSDLQELQRKAALYDRLLTPSLERLEMNLASRPSNLPPNCTVMLKNLPQHLKVADLVHSINAPGGLRLVTLFEGLKSSSSILSFVSASSAEDYVRYLAYHGFFTSQRASQTHPHDGPGENLVGIQLGQQNQNKVGQDGVVRRFWVLKRHIPGVEITYPARAPSKVRDDVYVTDIEMEINNGATRCIRFQGKASNISAEFGMFLEGTKVFVEGMTYFENNRGEEMCIMRFGSVQDACVIKRYFGLRKGWENKCEWTRDVCDKSVEALGWDELKRCEDADEGAKWVGGDYLGTELLAMAETKSKSEGIRTGAASRANTGR